MTSVGVKRFSWLTVAMLSLGAVPVQGADAPLVQISQEFPLETAAIVAATSEFFDQVEQVGVQDTPERPVISMPQVVSPASTQNARDLAGQGPVSHLTAYRVSWYPMDRFLGSVDFMGTWNGNRNLVCGYLTWDLTDPDAPVLENVSATYVDVADLASTAPSDIHAALLEANCAHGAIEANYTFFDVES